MERISFTRQALNDLAWEEPMLSLAKKYDIADIGLRKVCLRMDIPVPPMGYWQKGQFGKRVKKVKLPSSYDGEGQYTLRARGPEDKFRHGEPSPMRTRQKKIESGLTDELAVPERPSNPFKLITEVREYLKTPCAKSYRYEGIVESGSSKLNIRLQMLVERYVL